MTRSTPLVLAAAALAAACDAPTGTPVFCTSDLRITMVVHVLDEAGRPDAAGATATISQDGFDASAEGLFDANPIYVAAENRGGVFDLRVTKLWHTPAVVEGVKVPVGPCGVTEAPEVTVTLPLEPGAPAMRQVVLPSAGYGFGACGLSATVPASVEADPSVSHALRWISRDTLAATVDAGGRITAGCHGEPTARSTHIVAMAVADTTVRDSVQVASR